MPTIKDVANKANVSTATISHVLNGTKFVTEEVKERVLSAVKETGYIPNNVARSLKVNKTKTIGMIVAYIENPIYAGIFREVEFLARKEGYSVIVCNSNDDAEVEEQQIKLLLSNKVDGLIIVPAKASKIPVKNIIPPEFPLVLLNRKIEGYSAHSVGIENEKATYQAVSHLVKEHGITDIAFILGEKTNQLSKERKDGYERALKENNIPLDKNLIYEGHSTFQGGGEAATLMLSGEKQPEAAFVAGTTMLLGVMFQLKKMRISCPEDIAIIGFSDTNMNLLMDPPISSVAQPISQLAENSLQLILKQIKDNTQQKELVVLPCKINYRVSCGCTWEPDLEEINYNSFHEKFIYKT